MKSHIHSFNCEYRRLIGNIALPSEIAGRYQIENCLNETPEKAVFLVRGIADGMLYILKTSSKNSCEDLSTEYAFLSDLSHPCIPKAVAFVEQDEWQYLVREYIAGKTLSALIAENGPLPVRKAADIVERFCSTLSYLHRLNPPVIHRDIKPQNILLAEDGRCVLIDFGIARRFDSEAGQDTICMGTQATAAPEQFGYRQTDVRSDVYSTGILLLFLTTGSFQPDSLSFIHDRALRSIINRCIRFDPADRYTGIPQLQRSLARFLYPGRRLLFTAAVLAVSIFAIALILLQVLRTQTAIPAQEPSAAPTSKEAPVDEGYMFASPLIEQAVRDQLGISTDTPVMPEDLNQITGLYLCGTRIYDAWNDHDYYTSTDYINGTQEQSVGSISTLADIANMHNLTELALFNQMITDISPLSGLPLTKLGLGGNLITDVSPLAELTGLTSLYLEDNPLSDIGPLQNLYQLETLDLSDTHISDFAPLGGLPLGYLSLMNCPIQDCTPLRALPKLNWLRLSNLSSEQAAICGELTHLNNLTLYYCGITSLEPFSKLENLLFLDLLGNDLTSLNGVDRYPLLSGLCINDNPVIDLTPLTELPKLTYVNVGSIPAINFGPLADIPNLEKVDCSLNQQESIQNALYGRNVTINAY